jgi:Nuclease-related domain.
MIGFLLICIIVVPILYYIFKFSYAFFRFLLNDTDVQYFGDGKVNREKFKIYTILFNGFALLIVLVFLYPLGYALTKGIIGSKDPVELFFNMCWLLIFESSIKAFKIIPVEIGLLIIFNTVDYFFKKSVNKEKELILKIEVNEQKLALEREEKEKELKIKRDIEIKNNRIQTANSSLSKLSLIGLPEVIPSLIAKYKLFTYNSVDKITPEVIKLPSTEHYDFTSTQLYDIKEIMKNMVLQSVVAKDYDDIRAVAEDKESSIENLIYILTDKLSSTIQIPENASRLISLNNTTDFFNPLSKVLTSNGLEIDIRNLLLNKNKATDYRAVFSEMTDELMKQFRISRKGFMGEQKVSEHLELYRDVIINLENVRFGVEGTTVEADNIIICENGVFCIETKNYGHAEETIVITKDGRWRRFKGRVEIDMENVSAQHNRHIAIMQRTVNQELKKRGFEDSYIFFEPIYVMANDDVQIKNESNEINLLRTSSIYPYINKFQTRNPLSKELQEAIRDIILDYKQELIKYPVSEYRQSFRYEFERLLMDIENKDVPAKIYGSYVDHIEEKHRIEVQDIDGERYIELK